MNPRGLRAGLLVGVAIAGCTRVNEMPQSSAVAALPAGTAVTLQSDNGYHIDLIDAKKPDGPTATNRIVRGMLSNSNHTNDRLALTPGPHRVTLAYQNGYTIGHVWFEHDFVAGHAYFVGPRNSFDIKTIKLSDTTTKQSWLIDTGAGKHAITP